jgi:hypothetical protein
MLIYIPHSSTNDNVATELISRDQRILICSIASEEKCLVLSLAYVFVCCLDHEEAAEISMLKLLVSDEKNNFACFVCLILHFCTAYIICYFDSI